MRLPGLVICLSLAACGGGGAGDGFASTTGPGVTTVSGGTGAGSSGSGAGSSTSGGGASGPGSSSTASSTSSSGSTTSASSTTSTTSTISSSESASDSSGTIYDLGTDGDFGPVQPAGCKGKIDFLFVMQRVPNLVSAQEKLVAAFPEFIDTIQDKFAGFDVHIMVIDSDSDWGASACEPDGCLETGNNGCQLTDHFIPDYPCGVRDALKQNQCYFTMGAGVVYNAGFAAANTPCKVDGLRRYITQDQSDLKDTFACMAQVGASGGLRIGAPVVAAVGEELNADGGCNAGFLRKDALLMITLVVGAGDISEGTPEEWAEAVFAAKNGNKDAVVMLGLGKWGADPEQSQDNLSRFVRAFPLHKYGFISDSTYGDDFAAAVALVDEACQVFTPG